MHWPAIFWNIVIYIKELFWGVGGRSNSKLHGHKGPDTMHGPPVEEEMVNLTYSYLAMQETNEIFSVVKVVD
jgi:hypothetical protein